MDDQITSNHILAAATGAAHSANGAQKSGGNGSSFSDKIQFSEILGATVDSPEKTYSDAQKPKDPADNNQVAKISETDQNSFGKKYDDDLAPTEKRDADFESSPKGEVDADADAINSRGQEHSEGADDGNKQAASKNHSRSDTSREQNPDEVFSNKLPQDNVDQNQISAATAPVVAPKAPEKTETVVKAPRAVAAEKIAENVSQSNGKAPDSNGQVTSKAASEVLSGALKDTKISKVGEDLHKAVFKNTKEVVIEQKAPSIGNTLANKQERDMSQRVKNSAFATVKVSVEDQGSKMPAAPSHTKAPVAQLAEISLEENQSALSKAAAAKLAAAGEAKAANSHNINPDGKAAAQSSQENSLNTNQMLRQQAATIGAQQSATNQAATAPKSDIPNINAVAGPNAPSQPREVVKMAPPPPPPPKPPAPVEQIAVQIKKAIGEGVDKINIKLNPAHLGKVEVKMEIAKDGQLSAIVIAEKPETLDLLQRGVRGLEKALQEGGLKTDLQSFQFSLKEQAQQQAATGRDQNNGQQGQTDQNKNGSDGKDAHSIASQAAVYGQNVATNGGVDIRI